MKVRHVLLSLAASAAAWAAVDAAFSGAMPAGHSVAARPVAAVRPAAAPRAAGSGVIAGGTGAPAEPGADPYAASFAKSERETLKQIGAQVHGELAVLYFAAGCKVIGEGYMMPTVFAVVAQLMNAGTAFRIPITWDPITPARTEGMARASRDGCDYWKKNPAQVAEIRHLTETVRTIPH